MRPSFGGLLSLPLQLQTLPTPPTDNTNIVPLFATDPERAIELAFERHYGFVCQVIYRVLPDKVVAEDIAQEVFYDLWRKRDRIEIHTSLRAFLRTVAVNRTLNHIRDRKIVSDGEEALPELKSQFRNAPEQLELDRLKEDIRAAVDGLPERCRAVFALSRYEELSYKEIASRLEISVKTVENQMSKALKLLRHKLERYL